MKLILQLMMLIKPYPILILLFAFVSTFIEVDAQIWPGDIDNNGRTENVDLLYMGYAFGETGFQRATISSNWTAQPAGPLWGITFPGTSMDIMYADCNGDGVVDGTDIDAITANYAATHQVIVPAPLIQGSPGVDATVEVKRNTTDTLSEGAIEFFEFHLGPGHYTNFYGVSFTATFDTAYVDSVLQVFPASGWITNNDKDIVASVSDKYIDTNPANGKHGRIDVAYARTDGTPIMGSGLMGIFAIIMEDNINGKMGGGVIDFEFEVIDVRMIDHQLNFLPTVPSVSEFYILSTNVSDPVLEDNTLSVFPNPASQFMYVESEVNKINGFELFNLQGQLIQQATYDNDSIIKFEFEDGLTGVYMLKIHTQNGILIRKIIITEK